MSASNWTIDLSHSSFAFTVRHLMVSKVRGNFGAFSGALSLDLDAPANSSATVEVDAATISTRDDKRDGHLKSPDFFDVAKFPKIAFTSTSVAAKDKEHFTVVGDLTMHGVTKPVTLDVEYAGTQKDPWGGQRAGFSVTGTLDRKEFGLAWNQALDSGGVVLSDKVTLDLEIEAIQAK